MRPLKILSVILGIVLALAGIVLVTSGGFALGVSSSHSDDSGFFNTPGQEVGSYGFALTVPDINQQLGPRWEKWLASRARTRIRVKGTSLVPSPLFIGIAPTDTVSTYVSGVTRDRVQSIDLSAGSVQYDHVDGTRLPASPVRQDFWVARAEGDGTQSLEWDLRPGDWTVVIMNADATAPVAATMELGAHFGILTPLIAALTAGGLVLVALGITLMVLGTKRRRPPVPILVPHYPIERPPRRPDAQRVIKSPPPAPPEASPLVAPAGPRPKPAGRGESASPSDPPSW